MGFNISQKCDEQFIPDSPRVPLGKCINTAMDTANALLEWKQNIIGFELTLHSTVATVAAMVAVFCVSLHR